MSGWLSDSDTSRTTPPKNVSQRDATTRALRRAGGVASHIDEVHPSGMHGVERAAIWRGRACDAQKEFAFCPLARFFQPSCGGTNKKRPPSGWRPLYRLNLVGLRTRTTALHSRGFHDIRCHQSDTRKTLQRRIFLVSNGCQPLRSQSHGHSKEGLR